MAFESRFSGIQTKNLSLLDIQTILRHRNLTTTERYTRRISSLRPALKVLPRLKSHQNKKRTYEINRKSLNLAGDPYGTRTRVTGVRG
ncbi:MAG: hypothetical protein ABFS18_13450, partial [Thermodesulfobacteriota bacterium]